MEMEKMIRLLIEKELRDIIGSTKFALTFSVCAILILLTFYVGAKNHQLNRTRYEAAKTENLRRMEGLTNWLALGNNRIFLPPLPLEALVSGISNDIGRTAELAGKGEISTSDSRFNNDPIFATFRFLDLEFIFSIVLSLFAILFAYDAINGEKQRGTLRLSFARAVPRDKYILGKIFGSFIAVGIPLLIPTLLGCLILPILGIHLTGSEWIRLILIVVSGLLYFGVFLTLSICVSSWTQKPANSFLISLIVWILAVLIIPRAAVLLAGRAVDVPSVDELAYQKGRYRSQLWQEDKNKLAQFKPSSTEDPQAMAQEFNKFMQGLTDERDRKNSELSHRLDEERRNRQFQQQRLAFNLARISPSAVFSLATTHLAGTSLELKHHFFNEAKGYQKTYGEFQREKTGHVLGHGQVLLAIRSGGEEEEEPTVDPSELPTFNYRSPSLPDMVNSAALDVGLLILFNMLFFSGAFVGFLKYDVR